MLSLRAELDCKLRQLVINAFKTVENINNDSPPDLVDEASRALAVEIVSIEDWVFEKVNK